MNIFVLDRDPIKAAQMMCDAHVVKMIVESCQLLSTHDRLTNRFENPSLLYKPTHVNHPCRVCLSNKYNRAWLICHLDALIREYIYRYEKPHKSASLYHEYYYNSVFVPSAQRQFADEYGWWRHCDLPKCMPDDFKVGGDDIDSVIRSYRNYYKFKQQTMQRFRYTKREMPEWLR